MSESRSRPVKLHPQDKTVVDRLAARLGCTRVALMRVGVAYLVRLDRDTVGQLVDEQKATRVEESSRLVDYDEEDGRTLEQLEAEYRELAVRAVNGTAEPTNPWNRPEQKVEQPPVGVERLFDEDEG